MSAFIYAALKQSVTPSQALADPLNTIITLDRDFLLLPFLQGFITDQHLIDRDRLGRTPTFMARIVADGWAPESRVIAIDRETAVLVEASGRAPIVGNADSFHALRVLHPRRRAAGSAGFTIHCCSGLRTDATWHPLQWIRAPGAAEQPRHTRSTSSPVVRGRRADETEPTLWPPGVALMFPDVGADSNPSGASRY